MKRDAGDLREFFHYAVLKGAGDVVDLGDGQAAAHGAVAGDEDLASKCALGGPPTLYLADNNSVVYNLA
jgi:hypothetical protein